MRAKSHTCPQSTDGPAAGGAVVRVAVPQAVPSLLDYRWDGDSPACPGQFVEVDVGRRRTHALVVETAASSPYSKLKLARPLNMPPLAGPTAQFYRWVARYTLAFPGDPLRAALMRGAVPERPAPARFLVATGVQPDRMTPARGRVLTAVPQGQGWQVGTLAQAAGVSDGVVRGLVEAGVLAWVDVEDTAPEPHLALPQLTLAQGRAAGEIAAAMASGQFKPMLLDGVMGSGKTEVYFEAIARLMEEVRTSDADGAMPQALVLVPEIALTPQWLSRFEARFGFAPVIWHSQVADGARKRAWWQVFDGTAPVVVGARSALFLPFRNLKLVIVDEEHDPSFKQDEGLRYHGRDMAVALSRLWACPVVLSSATPSLESWHNVQTGRYELIQLPERHGAAGLPEVRTVDLRKLPPDKPDHWLSPVLLAAMGKRLNQGEQTLLFLNRRGLAPVLLCKSCGHRFDCPACDASLIVHGNRLACHHCGHEAAWPAACPDCGHEELRAYGPGTRKVMAQVQAQFPDANVAVADSDAISSPRQMGEIVAAMEAGKIDILVGTQMVAKGHHFPNLTLVGVVDSDMGLAHGDLRAAERTFQLLMQVGGRAGRAGKKGEVLLQTHAPEHPLFDALRKADRDQFYQLELDARKTWGDPPFGRQVALIVSGPGEREVAQAAQALVRGFPTRDGLSVLGPAPAPLARLKNRYRYRLLVKARGDAGGLHDVVLTWLADVPVSSRVRVDIDVDPVTFV